MLCDWLYLKAFVKCIRIIILPQDGHLHAVVSHSSEVFVLTRNNLNAIFIILITSVVLSCSFAVVPMTVYSITHLKILNADVFFIDGDGGDVDNRLDGSGFLDYRSIDVERDQEDCGQGDDIKEESDPSKILYLQQVTRFKPERISNIRDEFVQFTVSCNSGERP